MNHITPSRLCVTLVHGTWGENASFLKASSTFQAMLRERFRDRIEIVEFPWSGRNSQQMRLRAANEFATWFTALVENCPDVLHFVVAHSHGGNVVLWGLRNPRLRARVAGIVCMGTPFIHSSLRRFWPVSASYGLLGAAAANLSIGAGANWIGEDRVAEISPFLNTLGNLSVAGLSINFAKDKALGRLRAPLFLFGLSVFVFNWLTISPDKHSETLAIFANSLPGEAYLLLLSIARDFVFACYLLLLPWYGAFSYVESRANRLRRQFARAYPRMHLGGLRVLSVPVRGDEPLTVLTIVGWIAAVPRFISHWSVVAGFLTIQAGMSVYGGIAASRSFRAGELLSVGWLSWAFALSASVSSAVLGLSLTGAMIAVLYPFAITWYCLTRHHRFAFGIERPSLSLIGTVQCKDAPQGVNRSAEFRCERFSVRACMEGLGTRGLWALRHSWMYASPSAIGKILGWMEDVVSRAPVENPGPCDAEAVAPYSNQRTSAFDLSMWAFFIVVIGVWVFCFLRF